MHMLRRAFTLIELLTVIAIISVLAAILFPVFARAKASAKQTTCLSNLRQIGAATALYMSDSDGIFPSALDPSDKYAPDIWATFPDFQNKINNMPMLHEVLQEYVKSRQVFRCPSDTGTDTLDHNFPKEFKTSPTMFSYYGSSYLFRTEIAFRQYSDTSFRLPAETNVYFDGAGHWHGAGRGLEPDDNFETYINLSRGYRYNTLFGDFHAKSLTRGELDAAWAKPL